MIKLYNILNKSNRTDIKGFWIDNNKIYIDRIAIIKCNHTFDIYKNKLFNELNQLAIFYIKGNKAYIEDKQGNITVLANHIKLYRKYLKLAEIKALLKEYNGLTIFKKNNNYLIDIWKQ
jgi:hypothetical protein